MMKAALVCGLALLGAACDSRQHAPKTSGSVASPAPVEQSVPYGASEPVTMPAESTATAGPDAVLLTLADLKWIDDPVRPGTYQAAAEGDPDVGPAHFYLKYAQGFAGGLHSHTSDHGGWILAGTVILVIDGKETPLPPGAFYFVKGGKPHIAKCDPGAECIMTVDIRGKWDVVAEPAT
jgi:mannose-6-phosphate isomerase-like protein (cupin superfamily)